MRKKFNITGTCFSTDHYMADISKKMAQVKMMVDGGEYFIINRPRQYGKTTTLKTLTDMLISLGDYVVFNISFDGIGDAVFLDEQRFSNVFVNLLAGASVFYAPELTAWLQESGNQADDLNKLSNVISDLCNQTPKKVVLLIDEVDRSSNNQLFISFLAMLRNKYLARKTAKTFHSIVLAGVHDVKSLKIKMRPEDEQKLNSPWNIAADFKVDMNLYPNEIKPMLDEYAQSAGVKLNSKKISERIFCNYPVEFSLH